MQNSTGHVEFVELSNRVQLGKKFVRYDTEIKETRYDLREALTPFIPANAIDDVVAIIQKHNIVLRIETPRKESLGVCFWSHVICINNNLDKDRFLSVFLHEFAHMLTYFYFLYFAVHGKEFYYCFQELVLKFIEKNIIPKDMLIPIVDHTGDYEFYKKHIGFTFILKTFRIGCQVKYGDEIIIRGKGHQGLINCTRLSDNTVIKLDANTKVLPFLDLTW